MLKKGIQNKDLYILFAAIFILMVIWIVSILYQPTEPNMQFYLSTIWIVSSILLVFIFNFVLDRLLNLFLDWRTHTLLRFFLQMIAGTLLSLWAINLSYSFIKDQFTSAPPDANQMLLLNLYGFGLILPVFSLYFGIKFLKAWRKSELESERLLKENARSQMMTLRNHLDPHFLFNNLNILSSLIDKDVSLSQSYLDKFAEVYRIILKAEVDDLTTVQEELDLIENYIYLLKIRFEGSVIFNIEVDEMDKQKVVPPLAFQMLIENAIKHNKASNENPIQIEIKSIDDDYILVSNNKQEKKYKALSSRKGTGLENISKRIAFFSDRQMEIINSEEYFKVKIPLLKIENQ